MLPETATIEPIDAQIIRCLQLSPRVPFRTVAEVLAVSEQTVARRYRRLHRAGYVRVVGLLRPTALGQHNWFVRIQVRPSGAMSLARALAQRDDVNWVTLVSGGAEVVCLLRSRTEQARDDLLMERLPRTTPVLGLSVAMVLHHFVGSAGDPSEDYSGVRGALDADQERTIAATWTHEVPDDNARFDLDPGDLALIAALGEDGRAAYSTLASAVGWSESRVARRLPALIEGGALYLDVDVSAAALGLTTSASLWLTVTPAHLHAAGLALAAQPEVAFAGAVSGPKNLAASVVCRDVGHLYRFATDTVGAIDGVQSMEVSPILRHVKQSGALTDGTHLATE